MSKSNKKGKKGKKNDEKEEETTPLTRIVNTLDENKSQLTDGVYKSLIEDVGRLGIESEQKSQVVKIHYLMPIHGQIGERVILDIVPCTKIVSLKVDCDCLYHSELDDNHTLTIGCRVLEIIEKGEHMPATDLSDSPTETINVECFGCNNDNDAHTLVVERKQIWITKIVRNPFEKA